MHPKTTWWLAGSAIALFLFIYFFERTLPGSAEAKLPPPLLTKFDTNNVTAIEIRLGASTNKIRAEKRDHWVLTNPTYPAQESDIAGFLETLASLRAYEKLKPHEVLIQGAKNFGLDPMKARVTVEAGTNQYILVVGAPTPIANDLYVQLERSGEVFVTDRKLLESLPRAINDWRSTDLVNLDGLAFNRLQVRTGQRLFELERNDSNQWQIIRPVPSRADQDKVGEFLQFLRTAQVTSFVTDSQNSELDRFGLQNPSTELSFLQGTNRLYTVELGGAMTNQTSQIYARLIGQKNVVTVPKKLSDYVANPYKTFHDPHLLSLNPAELDRIVVRSIENFTLQRQPEGYWTIGEKGEIRADPALMGLLTTNLAALAIIDIAREVPTENDLKAFGLLNPVASFSLFQTLPNKSGITTNILFTEVSFGTNQADTIYCKRSDEIPVYVTYLAQELNLPARAFQMRDRQIWNFSPTNIASVTLMNSSATNSISRKNDGSWSDDSIANAAVDETLFRLSRLQAFNWVAEGGQKLPIYGIQQGSLKLSLQLKNDEKKEVQFGKPSLDGHVYAAVSLPGNSEPVVFKFPGALYQQMLQSLPVPK
jgi:hypothetical protein